MNQRIENLDFERLIQNARLQRSAAIASAMVDIVFAAGSALKHAFGAISPARHTAKATGTRQASQDFCRDRAARETCQTNAAFVPKDSRSGWRRLSRPARS